MELAPKIEAWFADHARPLPWRTCPREPYRVLVSELMLQQTQVERVAPLYWAFVRRFPSLTALAAAAEDDVMAAWSGLGYYRRARLLHRLARQVVVEMGGVLPGSAEALERLPGVGPYTAAAVASMGFGQPVPAVDGNVARVACRLLAFADPRSAAGRRRIADWVRGLLEVGAPGVVNEALMELGATVCRPVSPSCERCPLETDCRAHAAGRESFYPPPRPRRPTLNLRWVAACCIDPEGRWLLRRVCAGPILVGLWLPPIVEIADGEDPVERALGLGLPPPTAQPERVEDLKHVITHRQIRVAPVVVLTEEGRTDRDGGERWLDPRRPRFPTSSLLAKLVSAVAGRRPAQD